ncbi:MAG: hypothetical protein AB7O48_18890 [Cyclobacteriaceae bacterium]
MRNSIGLLTLYVIMAASESLSAQYPDPTNLPQEELVVFLNRYSFIPGEELEVAISAPVSSPQFLISRVAYIEFLDPNKQPVLQLKAELYEGKGSATLYLPSYLKSGVYTLLVYTQWQRNFGLAAITQQKITLLNPYVAIPKSLFEKTKSQDSLFAQFFSRNSESESIAYEIKNQEGEIVPAQLKIVNGSETLVDIKSQDGYGTINFAPKPGISYSVALIDNKNNVHLSNFEIEARVSLGKGIDSINSLKASLSLNKLTFKPREEIKLTLSTDEPIAATLVIQKKQPLENEGHNLVSHFFGPTTPYIMTRWPLDESTRNFLSIKSGNSDQETPSLKFLPDFRGELIEGTMISQDGATTANHRFHLTTVGESHKVYSAATNSDGTFKISLDPRYPADQLIFSGTNNFTVSLDSSFLFNYNFVETETLQLQNTDIQSWLVEKSQQVQIQSIYEGVKSESSQIAGFFADKDRLVYRLDDYARFPTMADHIIEYIPVVTIRKTDNRRELLIRNMDNRTGDMNRTLIALNGIVCSDEDILNFDPLKIERIEIYPRQFEAGGEIFTGAIGFFTYSDTYLPADQFGSTTKSYLRVHRKKPSTSSKPQANTRPDMRTQLAWEPHLLVSQQATSYTYYASDVPGTYSVTLVGVDGNNYVFETLEFTVDDK